VNRLFGRLLGNNNRGAPARRRAHEIIYSQRRRPAALPRPDTPPARSPPLSTVCSSSRLETRGSCHHRRRRIAQLLYNVASANKHVINTPLTANTTVYFRVSLATACCQRAVFIGTRVWPAPITTSRELHSWDNFYGNTSTSWDECTNRIAIPAMRTEIKRNKMSLARHFEVRSNLAITKLRQIIS